MTDERTHDELNDQGLMDPAQCPFRDTCPHLMQCVTDYLLELAREDWGMPVQTGDSKDGKA